MGGLKLNLGCGENYKEGYVNVDKCGKPNVLHDLETFPWPWDDGSVDEVLMNHVLEHLGESVGGGYGGIDTDCVGGSYELLYGKRVY